MLAGLNLIVATLALIGGVAAPKQLVGSERATLLQLSLDNPPPTRASELRRAMAEETARVTSCREALGLGQRLKTRGLHGSLKVDVRTNTALSTLPAPLRAALLARPIGRATPVYGGEKALRVLIRCEPTFSLPAQIPSTPPVTSTSI